MVEKSAPPSTRSGWRGIGLGTLEDRKRLATIASLAAVLIVSVLGPFFLSGYWVRVITGVFMWITIAQALNIISGYTGYPAFGNVVFFGLGAYATGVLMKLTGMSWMAAVPLGALFCVLFSIVIGFPLLRLRGHYFAVASLAVMEATREIIVNMDSLTGGGNGMILPLMDVDTQVFFNLMYWVMLGVAVSCIVATFFVVRSRWGYAFKAIRDHEAAAAVMGIDTTRYKILAWALSAFFTGLAGGVFAFWFSFIEPKSVFNMDYATRMFIMMLLGGRGTIIGPVIGASVLEIISELVWGRFLELHQMVLGIIIVLVIMFLPKGIVDLARNRFSLAYLVENIRKGGL